MGAELSLVKTRFEENCSCIRRYRLRWVRGMPKVSPLSGKESKMMLEGRE